MQTKEDQKLAFSLLTPEEKVYTWLSHLKNSQKNLNLSKEQIKLIEQGKQFISVNLFSAKQISNEKEFDIWKYRVTKLFNESLKAEIFNDIQQLSFENNSQCGYSKL